MEIPVTVIVKTTVVITYNDDCSCSDCSFIDGTNTCQVSITTGNDSGGGVSTGNNPTTTSTSVSSTSSSPTSSTSSGNNNDACVDFVCQPIICNIVSCEVDSLNNAQCVSTPQENGVSCIGGTCQEGQCKAQEVIHNFTTLTKVWETKLQEKSGNYPSATSAA